MFVDPVPVIFLKYVNKDIFDATCAKFCEYVDLTCCLQPS